MPARLYLFELSHPSQIALRMKGVEFEEREPVPLRLPEEWLPA
jgi:hypothetical protein